MEATFKLLPRPESETLLQKECNSLDEAGEFVEQILASDLQPCILDFHRINGQSLSIVAGFSGATADVEAQTSTARNMGLATKTTLVYDEAFRSEAHRTESLAPSELITTLKELGDTEFVARAGSGVIYSRGLQEEKSQASMSKKTSFKPSALQARIKNLFDPEGKLPSL